jgi:hypothetical protein
LKKGGARQGADREQEVVELNSKAPVRDERNKKQESLEVKIRDFHLEQCQGKDLILPSHL